MYQNNFCHFIQSERRVKRAQDTVSKTWLYSAWKAVQVLPSPPLHRGRRTSTPHPPLSPTQAGMSSRGSGGRSNGTLPQTKICQFKLVLLGDMAVGKSSLVLRFVKGQFDEFQETTIGGDDWEMFMCVVAL